MHRPPISSPSSSANVRIDLGGERFGSTDRAWCPRRTNKRMHIRAQRRTVAWYSVP